MVNTFLFTLFASACLFPVDIVEKNAKIWYNLGIINKGSEYEWFIAPIDGTINFASGIPLFSTSIALKENNETILGVVFDYNQNDIYYAIKGKGSYCNDKKLRFSENSKLKDSIISFCLTSHYNSEHIKDVLNVEETGGTITNLKGNKRENIDTLLVRNGRQR